MARKKQQPSPAEEAPVNATPRSAASDGNSGEAPDDTLAREISKLLDECRLSQAVHNRRLKDLFSLLSASSSSSSIFLLSFLRSLSPLFNLPRRSPPSERVVRFVSSFAAATSTSNSTFLDNFLRSLLLGSAAAHKTARFRSCQIISEIIMRLPDDADVTGDVWDEVIVCMKRRLGDKIPAIRVLAVRALSRFSGDPDNTDIVDLLLEILPGEPNVDVRKTIVLSIPPSSATVVEVIGRTLDISETVRKAAYAVLAAKFPLQSLSIKQRTIILERGLADRSGDVRKECLKVLKEKWLGKSCDGDPIALMRFLDVETYESVGEAVMKALLEDGAVQISGDKSLRQLITAIPGHSTSDVKLLEPEDSFYWRMVCKHLHMEAESKGCDAAVTMGAEAAIYASQASINNDLLEDILPVTVSDYVALVKGHLSAGSNYRFVTRQLLLLGAMFDFSDLSNKKVASALVKELLHCPPELEVDDEGNEIVIGDGISLGGDANWAKAVSWLAKKVHASTGEFEEVVADVIEELASPCRERIANPLQWMHCLAVTGLLLENIESFFCLQRKAIEPTELLHSLLLSGAKHVHIEVQRVSIRCLCLFGLLEKKPSGDLVKQVRLSFINGPSPVSEMACKALLDLATWHGAFELDKAINVEHPQICNQASFVIVDLNKHEDSNAGLLDLLYAGFDGNCIQGSESEEGETVQGILGEGFAKLLLLSENQSSISTSLHPLVLAKLIRLYFTSETNTLERLKQCLSVFFEHYPALSVTHKGCLSKAFIPVMRSLWPSIYGNAGCSNSQISRLRKRAVQAAQFMLQMMQAALISTENQEENISDKECGGTSGAMLPSDIDNGEECLGIRIAAEVISFPEKKNAHGRSYISALCRTIVLLNFRSSHQIAIKCMRGLLNCIIESSTGDRESIKDLTLMASRLRSLDENPDEEPSKEVMKEIFEKLEVEDVIGNLNLSFSMTMPPPTPAAPRSTRTTATKRRVRHKTSSSEDEDSPVNCVSVPAITPSVRSQRASKTAAMSRMSTKATISLSETENEEGSDVTDEEDSGETTDEFLE